MWIASDDAGNGHLHGLNASGNAPAALTPEAVTAAGHTAMPLHGWTPVTVPGTPSAWAELSRRFGKLDFASLLAPAIRLAHEGFPVSPVIASLWQRDEATFRRHLEGEATQAWFETFSPAGRAPEPANGTAAPTRPPRSNASPRPAPKAFIAASSPSVSTPSRAARGATCAPKICRLPTGMGCAHLGTLPRRRCLGDSTQRARSGGLMALRMLEGFEPGHRDAPEVLHRQLEAMKLAFADGQAYITQAEHMSQSVEALLSDAYIESRRRLIGDRALTPEPGTPPAGGTVYLATADTEGNMVSYIQSNYHGFGSGVVVPGTGIALQNRGHDFSLDPNHDNYLAPGKKTYHTIIPGFLTRGGKALGPFGVMGGYMQPQAYAGGDEPSRLRPQPPGRTRCTTLAMAGRATHRHRTRLPGASGPRHGRTRPRHANRPRRTQFRAWPGHPARS